MPLPPPPPKTSQPAAASSSAKTPPLAFRRVAAEPGPVRLVLNCAEGWGKTTVLAHAANPVIIMAPQESGFESLRHAGRVPDVPCTRVATFAELLTLIRGDAVREFDTVCIDAIGGMVQMLASEVLKQQFGGDSMKFASYGRGQAVVDQKWMTLLSALEDLALTTSVIAASHVEIQNFANPEGDNYGRFVGDSPKGVWAATKRWADAVLFGTFFTAVEDGKASGGTDRVLYTEHRATHDAKNRWGMPSMIKMPSKPEEMFDSVFSHIPTNKGN